MILFVKQGLSTRKKKYFNYSDFDKADTHTEDLDPTL